MDELQVCLLSRKELKMSCGHCGTPGHNKRSCSLLERGSQVLPDVPLLAPQPSQQSVFMPTPGFVPSAPQPSNEAAGPSNLKRKAKDKHVEPVRAFVDEDEDEDEFESEDETPIIRPRSISEAKTRIQMKKLHQKSTDSRKINFKGDESGVSMPTNLPYSPRKLTWKGKSCVTSNQLVTEKERKIGKLKAKTVKN